MIAPLSALLLAMQASPDFGPLTVGETANVSVLEAEREINVVLPQGYADNEDQTWPVVFMIDGGMQQDLMLGVGIHNWNRLWGRSSEAIFVGIETKDRQRELLPPTRDAEQTERYPTAGQSAEFRRWLVDEIVPTITKRYRTSGQTYLVGESAAGHFVVETWFDNPAAFSGYAAISPSLQWNFEGLSKAVAADSDERPPIYLSLADEGGALASGVLRLVESLSKEHRWCFSDRRDDLRHSNVLHGLLPEALQFLLPTDADWLEEFGFVLQCDRGGQL